MRPIGWLDCSHKTKKQSLYGDLPFADFTALLPEDKIVSEHSIALLAIQELRHASYTDRIGPRM